MGKYALMCRDGDPAADRWEAITTPFELLGEAGDRELRAMLPAGLALVEVREARRAIDRCTCGHDRPAHVRAGEKCVFCPCPRWFPHPQPAARR